MCSPQRDSAGARAEPASHPSPRSPERAAAPGSQTRVPAEVRAPTSADAADVWRLVRDSEVLDLNSPYAYLVLCSDFAETCLVAESDGETVGFVGAYVPPERRDVVFVWQIATAARCRGRGLGARLLDALLERPACRDVHFLEATVTPSNRTSRALFESLARRHGVPCRDALAFDEDLFPTDDHEAEIRLRIGPLRRRRPDAALRTHDRQRHDPHPEENS